MPVKLLIANGLMLCLGCLIVNCTHMHLYPIEVNTADYEMLLRIPGIGVTYAARIIKARKYCKITHDVLRALGVSLKRSRHFLTCNGKYQGDKCSSAESFRSLVAFPLDDGGKGIGANSVEDCF